MDLDVYGCSQEVIDAARTSRSERHSLDHVLHAAGHHDPDDPPGGAGAYSGARSIRFAGDDAGGDRLRGTAWPDGAERGDHPAPGSNSYGIIQPLLAEHCAGRAALRNLAAGYSADRRPLHHPGTGAVAALGGAGFSHLALGRSVQGVAAKAASVQATGHN